MGEEDFQDLATLCVMRRVVYSVIAPHPKLIVRTFALSILWFIGTVPLKGWTVTPDEDVVSKTTEELTAATGGIVLHAFLIAYLMLLNGRHMVEFVGLAFGSLDADITTVAKGDAV